MAEAAWLELPYPETAVIEADTLEEQNLALAADLPERPLILGGCCCSHIGAVEGLAARQDRLSVIWFDAHGDLNTVESSPSGNLWGMPLRKLIDSGAVDAGDVALVGARNLDPPEEAFIRDQGIQVGEEGIVGALEGADCTYIAFDADVLEPSAHTTHCPFKGDASYWHVRVGDRLVENALWAYENPLPEAPWLRGFGSLYWHKADAWYEEDERLVGHIRDPYHRVDVRRTSRGARVLARGELVAESARPVLLFETGLPTRVYFERGDVRADLEPSEKRTVCPYKGIASYWSVEGLESAAWSYEEPLDGAGGVRGLVSFLGEGIEVELEGAGVLDTSAMV